jgi:hypothetical protein
MTVNCAQTFFAASSPHCLIRLVISCAILLDHWGHMVAVRYFRCTGHHWMGKAPKPTPVCMNLFPLSLCGYLKKGYVLPASNLQFSVVVNGVKYGAISRDIYSLCSLYSSGTSVAGRSRQSQLLQRDVISCNDFLHLCRPAWLLER